MGIISEIILFTSQVSQTCTPCINLIREYTVPAKIVRLDTPETRKKAKYNKKISITKVPTLAVVFDDDDIKIYIGGEKICKWLRNFHEQQTKPSDEGEEPLNQDTTSNREITSNRGVTVIDTASDDDTVNVVDTSNALNAIDTGNTVEEFSLPSSFVNSVDDTGGGITNELGKAKSSKMKNTLEIAKEMEAQAKKQLGGDAFSRRNDY
jgi:hypothetical protein